MESFWRTARKLEDNIRRRLQGTEISDEPLEIWRGIAREIEDQIHPVKSGRVFPYSQVMVTMCPSSEEKEAVLGAAFVEAGRLEKDIKHLLQECGSEVPEDLAISVTFVREPQPEWITPVFNLQCVPRQIKQVASQEQAKPVRETAILRITRGKAAESDYLLYKDVTYIGRGASGATADGGSWTNDIVFEDSDEDPVNGTVSRKHARIVFEPDTCAYVLYDQHSSRGTSVVRSGRSTKVPEGLRGRRLMSGDRILFGKAAVEFVLIRAGTTGN
jgi:hypothetical protein